MAAKELTSTETIRFIRDGAGEGGGGRGYGGGGRGRLDTYRNTVTTRMTPAFRWAATRAILMFHNWLWGTVTRQCPQTTTFWRGRRAEADSNRGPSAYCLLLLLFLLLVIETGVLAPGPLWGSRCRWSGGRMMVMRNNDGRHSDRRGRWIAGWGWRGNYRRRVVRSVVLTVTPDGCTAVAPAPTKKHRCQGNGRLLQGWHPSAGTLVPVGTPVWSVMGSLSLSAFFF